MNIRFLLFGVSACISLIFLFFQIVFADELVLKNGDRLTGTLIEARDGKLTFHTDYTDEIILDMEAVKTIITGKEGVKEDDFRTSANLQYTF